MSRLMISISGIRGVVGETLTPELILKLSLAFGTYIKGNKKIIIGTDTRITRDMVKSGVISGLLATGCEVIDIGIAPTPTVQNVLRKSGADGAVIITASHNPIEWNALKLYKKGGILLNKKEGEAVLKIFKEEKFKLVKWNKFKKLEVKPELTSIHIDSTLQGINFLPEIKKRKFKVALDSCNASGSYITVDLLKKLNATVKGLYITPDGYFPHSPEPNAKNLTEIVEFMKQGKYDIGFAQDSDADRLAILDENGNFLSEEYTVAVAVYYILTIYDKIKKLQKYNKSVVVNISTSRMIDDIAKKFGVKVYRTKVGEINVVEKLLKTNSVIGGEGNGGVIFPEINLGRDSLAGIGLILDFMAYSGKKLSEILADIPHYILYKTKFNIENLNLDKIIKKIKKDFSKGKINEIDGVRIDFDDFWFQIRSSNTEPIARLFIEAKDKKIINSVLKELKKYFIVK